MHETWVLQLFYSSTKGVWITCVIHLKTHMYYMCTNIHMWHISECANGSLMENVWYMLALWMSSLCILWSHYLLLAPCTQQNDKTRINFHISRIALLLSKGLSFDHCTELHDKTMINFHIYIQWVKAFIIWSTFRKWYIFWCSELDIMCQGRSLVTCRQGPMTEPCLMW